MSVCAKAASAEPVIVMAAITAINVSTPGARRKTGYSSATT